MSEWPVTMIERIWHVGSMDPTQKGRGSYEGSGLSVSVHPEEWSQIARLPGDTWALDRPEGRFLDVHALDEGQLAVIAEWAVEAGLCERVVVFRAESTDEEGEPRYFDCASREKAMYELGIVENDDGDGYVDEINDEDLTEEEVSDLIQEIDSLRATQALLDQMRQNGEIIGEFARDLAIIAYGSANLDVDGCWWNDCLDPDALSAPRGVIYQERLAGWTVNRADDLDDEADPELPSP